MQNSTEAGPLREFLEERTASRPKRITIRNGEKITFLPTEQIDWIESAGNYVVLHCGEENHILRETMAGLEEQLAPDSFYRLSRSAIVNLRRIKRSRDRERVGTFGRARERAAHTDDAQCSRAGAEAEVRLERATSCWTKL